MFLAPAIFALILSLLLIPLIRRISFRLGRVSQPREDRWHRSPTPTLGGVGIFLSFFLCLIISRALAPGGAGLRWDFLVGGALMFLIGLYDDFRPMSPAAKLVGQILAATSVVILGYTSTFFDPRIPDSLLAQLPNILLTYAWLIGITNAINLLDNMDGLAGGISLITAGILAYFFWQEGNNPLLWVTMALVGSVMGFLVFNFPPAKIFMGDSGSLFLGFTLATLAIVQQQQASNVFAVVGVPTLIFLLPILDTALVTITRLMRGQSPMRGGRDHTSHRLVAFGLNERQALWVLYSVVIFSAVTAAVLESLNYWLSLVLAPLLILSLAVLTAYLGRLKVVSAPSPSRQGQAVARFMLELTQRRRLLDVILDFFLIGIAYYLAFLISYNLQMDSVRLETYLVSLPFTLASTFLVFYGVGVYRSLWRYVDFDDLTHYLQAAIGSVALLAAIFYLLESTGLASWAADFLGLTLLLYGIFLFLGLTFTRSSFKVLDLFSQHRIRQDGERVLIVGAGDAGEMTLRWIGLNPQYHYHPVGILDPDPLLTGRQIHGIPVLGSLEKLPSILERSNAAGVILAFSKDESPWTASILHVCQEKSCWVRTLRLDFELVDGLETKT